MKRDRLNRRTFLRGAGGAMVALPALEIMLDNHGVAYAQGTGTIPTRYAILFCGSGLSLDNRARDQHFIRPPTLGAAWETTTPLQPLEAQGLKGDVSVVSNLFIPTGNVAGGCYPDFHCGAKGPLLSGRRTGNMSEAEGGYAANNTDKTSDQIVADAIGGSTLRQSLVYMAQANWYAEGEPYGREYMSYRGWRQPIAPQTSPQLAYDALFGNFQPPDVSDAPSLDLAARKRLSVLDVVRASTERLLPRLGLADRRRIEQHFQHVRDLETRLRALPPEVSGICSLPADPGADSPVDQSRGGYSMEHERARLFCDLIHMAMACDLSRVATLMITMFQSHMRMQPLGYAEELHEIGHNGNGLWTPQHVALCLQWHVAHYAYLLQKMKDTPEGDGTLLDHSVVVFMPEAGHGMDVNGDPAEGQTTHSTENMILLVAGRGGGLSPGHHVDGARRHPARVLVSAMQAAGASTDTLGDITGNVPELFG